MVANDISNRADMIDSRDIIERIDELESELANATGEDGTVDDSLWGEDEQEELDSLLNLQSQCDFGDWQYGATLIRDSYFEDYAQQEAEDLGFDTSSWPGDCIDWSEAAEELQQDYMSVEYDGVTYWLRG